METNWDQVRTNYPLISKGTYINTSYCGAMSNQTVQVQKDCLDVLLYDGNKLSVKANHAADEIRQSFLDLTSARAHQSALISDVSTAMNVIAETLRGKKVALLEEDFPAVTVPWITRGYDVQWVPRVAYQYPNIKPIIESGVEVLVLSWVMYNSGTMMDLKEIGAHCKKHDCVLIVDATQGLGANKIDLSDVNVDVLFASCFKWFLSGYGIGIAIAKNKFIANHPIQFAGQHSVLSPSKSSTDMGNIRSGLRRMEMGHIKSQQVLALHSSLSQLNEIGLPNIQKRTQELMDYLVSRLVADGHQIITPSPRSTNIVMIKGTEEIFDRLQSAGIEVTFRHGLIRLGIYFYNNKEDVNRLVKALSV